eukprot:6172984-Pleurochrysis_carterae.AAC.2
MRSGMREQYARAICAQRAWGACRTWRAHVRVRRLRPWAGANASTSSCAHARARGESAYCGLCIISTGPTQFANARGTKSARKAARRRKLADALEPACTCVRRHAPTHVLALVGIHARAVTPRTSMALLVATPSHTPKGVS